MEFKNVLSTNAGKRGLIAFVLFVIFGFMESKVIPWGLGLKSVIPLSVTYLLLSTAVGTSHDKKIEDAAIHGAIIGAMVYSVIFFWLFDVGFFSGSMIAGMGKLIFAIVSVSVVSVILHEVSSLLKISEDN